MQQTEWTLCRAVEGDFADWLQTCYEPLKRSSANFSKSSNDISPSMGLSLYIVSSVKPSPLPALGVPVPVRLPGWLRAAELRMFIFPTV